MGFYLAREFECDYIQIDSVVGHVKPRDEYSLQAFFDLMRKEYDGYVLGGVRFKYQPVLSEKSLKEDLEIAKSVVMLFVSLKIGQGKKHLWKESLNLKRS